MKFRGGYNVHLAGRPAGRIEAVPEPDHLCLPLEGRRFRFTELRVRSGQRVRAGQALACDPRQHALPLPAPRSGVADLLALPGHIVLRDLRRDDPQAGPDLPEGFDARHERQGRLLSMGAWQWFQDARVGGVPDPLGTPQAVIVSLLRLEPFLTRGDMLVRDDVERFVGGLAAIQSLLEYQPIYLVLPEVRSELARRIRQAVRGCAWLRLVQVPLRYPADHFRLLARRLGLKGPEPVWALPAQGVLAAERVLVAGRPATDQVVALGGPCVKDPTHLLIPAGYPLAQLLQGRLRETEEARVLDGGVLTGRQIAPAEGGVPVGSEGLLVLPEHRERELLSFLRPGRDRRSRARCFLSAMRGQRPEPLTTALRGERRPCIACGLCEQICPARILPHLIHKLIYQQELEEVERARADLCVGCGLCAYVCPSKIDLLEQIDTAKARIRAELHGEEATA